MNMKEHILAALKEKFDAWEELLATLTEEQITTPRFDLAWSIKDVIAHLWAWQQISIARMEAGLQNREPQFAKWIVESVENWEEDADQVNAVTFERNHAEPWSEVHQNWRSGFLRLLEVANKIPEINLLASGLYPWLGDFSLAFILVASYDHHQEHYDKLLQWLNEHRK